MHDIYILERSACHAMSRPISSTKRLVESNGVLCRAPGAFVFNLSRGPGARQAPSTSVSRQGLVPLANAWIMIWEYIIIMFLADLASACLLEFSGNFK